MSVPPEVPRKRSRAPVLILVGVGCFGLLIVGGIVAAIVIPNFAAARDRARLQQSMSIMRSVGEALQGYYEQNGRYPEASSMSDLASALAPHTESLPTSDSWGHELRYLCWPEGAEGCEHYTLVSPGKDGRFEQEDLTAYQSQETNWREYGRDLVLSDGYFLQYPSTD
ncbi:MAG TPA: type II secretion system protein GspG [Gemmatimonadaceae bacterium]|nr:type II secretion system protein GspG [Gemmatimonadaceae bacterium]